MNQEFKPTILYIKTHNVTGLKYFGKTTKKDIHKYMGSGTYWKQHIKKHGYDVTTEIVGLFTDKIWIQLYALDFSETNNIVINDDWANLIPENGIDGVVSGIKWTPERKANATGKKSHHYGKKRSDNCKIKISKSQLGKKRSDTQKRNTSESCREKIPLKCIETGSIFDGPAYAADWLISIDKLKVNSGSIKRCCDGNLKSAYKLHWEWVNHSQ